MLSSHVPSSTAVFLTFLVPVCLFAGIQSQISVTPAVKCVLPEESIVTVTCKTTTKALLWIYNRTDQKFYNKDSMPNEQADLGIFTVRLTMIDVVGDNVNLTSLATVSVSSLVDRVTVITCDGDGDGLNGRDALLINGPPSPSSVTSIVTTQSSTNSSSLLISWSMSDCAVQYVVTIINSSDGSVYLNITTSDTNTTVTLPTGVEYCVTVLGVDSIGRRGPPSQQQCYTPISPETTMNNPVSTAVTSDVTVTPSPTDVVVWSQQAGVLAALVIIPVIILGLLLAVLVVVTVLLCCKGYHKRLRSELPLTTFGNQCVRYIFYQENGHNSWKVLLVFSPSTVDTEAMKRFYHDYEVYGLPLNCHLQSSGTIQVQVPNKPDGWTVHWSDTQVVHKATIEGYTGEGSPPHIEMMITADSDKTTPPDLTVEAKLNGVSEPNFIKFEKKAQVKIIACQVFYHKEALNHWTATVTFFPKQHLERVRQFYQDANISPTIEDVQFTTTIVGKPTINPSIQTVSEGWHIQDHNGLNKINKSDVLRYDGVGKPPHCEVIFKAIDNIPPDLTAIVTFGDASKITNTLTIRRMAAAASKAPNFSTLQRYNKTYEDVVTMGTIDDISEAADEFAAVDATSHSVLSDKNEVTIVVGDADTAAGETACSRNVPTVQKQNLSC